MYGPGRILVFGGKEKKASEPGGVSERERSQEMRMHGISLVVQGLRLCLLMQSMRGEFLA